MKTVFGVLANANFVNDISVRNVMLYMSVLATNKNLISVCIVGKSYGF